LEQAVERQPANRDLIIKLADALLAADRKQEAAQRYEQARRLGGESVQLLLKLAKLYNQLQDRASLLAVHKSLVKLRPDDREVNYNLGLLYWEGGEPDLALECLEKARDPQKTDRELEKLIFNVLVQLARWDQAQEVADKLVEDRPDDLDFLSLLYQALAGHRPDQFEEIMARASKANPQEARIYELRAAAVLDAKQEGKAAEILEEATRALPKNLKFWRGLASLYESLRKPSKALDAYARILELKPDDEEAQERYLQLKTGTLVPRGPFSGSDDLRPAMNGQ
jgi:tetratricopeptide (TPR) repeat protein